MILGEQDADWSNPLSREINQRRRQFYKRKTDSKLAVTLHKAACSERPSKLSRARSTIKSTITPLKEVHLLCQQPTNKEQLKEGWYLQCGKNRGMPTKTEVGKAGSSISFNIPDKKSEKPYMATMLWYVLLECMKKYVRNMTKPFT